MSLLTAARLDQGKTAATFVSQDPSAVLLLGADDESSLHWACLNGNLELAKLLLANGAEELVNAPTKEEGTTPFHWAAIRGHCTLMSLLLSHGADVMAIDNRGYCALHHAVQHSRPAAVFFLVEGCDVDVNVPDRELHTPLMWAAFTNHIPTLELLLHLKADVTLRDATGWTALHWAANVVKLQICERLLMAGADVHAKDAEGLTAYDIAKNKGGEWVPKVLELSMNDPEVALRGRSAFIWLWTFLPFSLLMTFFVLSVYLPHPLLAAIAVFVPTVYYAQGNLKYKWIEQGDPNPAGLSIGMAVFVASSYVYWTRITPVVEAFTTPYSLFFMIYSAGWWYLLYRHYYFDPGFVPTNTVSVTDIMDSYARGEDIPYCFICMARKPLRSKHTKNTNRCIAKYDHWCLWMLKDVGLLTYKWFFVVLEWLFIMHLWQAWHIWTYFKSILPTGADSVGYLGASPYVIDKDPLASVVFFWHVLFIILGVGLNVIHNLNNVGRNLTTNESMGIPSKKYKYMFVNGQYVNPFDEGTYLNYVHFFYPKYDYYTLYELPEHRYSPSASV
eukprot:TRINITY_DN3101_c0_g1_i1.p1 TRINITY_DN3101_c0_g1~~TRINITY_DN3101_c0_g1_i1.p1  ORF type:complete len:559 (-),score=65.87 TRINITY_DN3101_c0_g1_i1:48-1724(-)